MSKVSKQDNIYTRILLTKKISLNYKDINSELYNRIQDKIAKNIEGLCIDEGYVKLGSVKLISYSSGELYSKFVVFTVIYECLVANPVESMIFDCIVKSITKVGIRAELQEHISPFIIFIARDHHYNNEMFSKIEVDDIINVRIIGQRYELNDKFISVIAELNNINKYETNKSDLIKGGDKIKIKIKKTNGIKQHKETG